MDIKRIPLITRQLAILLAPILFLNSCFLDFLFNPNKCAAPMFLPEPGFFMLPQEVTLKSSTEGAKIYYTTDGSNPDESSNLYTGSILVDKSTVIKAVAIKKGYSPSDISTGEYNIYDVTIKEASSGIGYDELSLAVTPDSSVHILCSYKDASNRYLRYVTNEDGTYSDSPLTSVQDTGYMYPSLARDTQGNLYECFYDRVADGINYFKKQSGGSWPADFNSYIATGFTDVSGTDISADNEGNIHVIFTDHDGSGNYNVWYYKNTGGNWDSGTNLTTTSPLDQLTFKWDGNSLSTDINGSVHIFGISEYPYSHLIYVTNRDGSWSYKLCDNTNGFVGYYDIAVDRDNLPHASYSTDNNYAINYINYDQTNDSLISQAIDTGDSGGNGYYNSIVVDDEGNVHISCTTGGYAGIKYITNISGNWETYIIDNDSSVSATAIGLIKGKFPVIAYSVNGYNNNKIKVANITW